MDSLFVSVILTITGYVCVSAQTTSAPCQDVLHNCRSYGDTVCVTYKDWAQANCAYTCKFCTGPLPVKECKDNIQNCAGYSGDICTADSYKVWAEDNCPKFCGFCGAGASTTIKTSLPPTTSQPVVTTPRPCQDLINFCLVHSKKACDDTAWADQYCRKWCGLC